MMLTFRIKLDLKEILRMATEREHHSIANLVVMLIMDYRDKNGILAESLKQKTKIK